MEINAGSVQLERAVLSCMILNDELARKGLLALSPDDFEDVDNVKVFAAIKAVHVSGNVVDAAMVCSALDRNMTPYIGELLVAYGNDRQFDQYISNIKERTRKKRFVAGFTEILESAKRGEDTCFSNAQELLNTLTSPLDAGMKQIKEFVPDAVNEIGSKEKGIRSGFKELDETIRGLCKGNLIIVAGRPSMGKSTFAANIATNVAKDGHVVAYFSLEMTNIEITQRMLFGVARRSEKEILESAISGDGYAAQDVFYASEKINDMKFFVNENTNLTVSKIEMECRKIAALEGRLDLAVIDYLGLVQSENTSGNRTRIQEVTEISHSLKRLAKSLNCPIILVSQLNRNSEGRADHTPMLSDLSESGAIEADADVVLFPYRPWVYDRDRSQYEAELIVAKNRNGAVKKIPLVWHGELFMFGDLAQ
jgi:replicative DNA helicase